MDSFWTGGSRAYQKALQKQHAQEIAELARRRDDSQTSEEAAAIEREVEKRVTEHRKELSDRGDLLF